MTGPQSTTTEVLAVTAPDGTPPCVIDMARAVAAVLHARVRTLSHTERWLDELAAPRVALAVLSRGPGLDWAQVSSAPKPIILVPDRRPEGRPGLRRVLVPLNGTTESASAIETTVGLFALRGVEVVLLHIFDAATVPRFWDQTTHASETWQNEFLARFWTHPKVRLEMRSGIAHEHVLTESVAQHVDLIALAWSQKLGSGHAQTVRRTVLDSDVPVMLVPIAT